MKRRKWPQHSVLLALLVYLLGLGINICFAGEVDLSCLAQSQKSALAAAKEEARQKGLKAPRLTSMESTIEKQSEQNNIQTMQVRVQFDGAAFRVQSTRSGQESGPSACQVQSVTRL